MRIISPWHADSEGEEEASDSMETRSLAITSPAKPSPAARVSRVRGCGSACCSVNCPHHQRASERSSHLRRQVTQSPGTLQIHLFKNLVMNGMLVFCSRSLSLLCSSLASHTNREEKVSWQVDLMRVRLSSISFCGQRNVH